MPTLTVTIIQYSTEACTIKLGGSRVLKLKNKIIYILHQHLNSDPQTLQWIDASLHS